MSSATTVYGSSEPGELVSLNDLGRDTYLIGIIDSVIPVGWLGWRFGFLICAVAEVPTEWLMGAAIVAFIDGEYRLCQISGRSYGEPSKFVALAEVGPVILPEDLDDDMKSPGAVTLVAWSETCVFLAA